MRYVLFVCTQNAGRSQMAEVFFTRIAPGDLRAESAGQLPAREVHPRSRTRQGAPWVKCGRSETRSKGGSSGLPPSTSVTSARTGPPINTGLANLVPMLDREFAGIRSPEEIRACADAVLDRYDDVPVRTHVLTFARRRAKDCLRAESCYELADT